MAESYWRIKSRAVIDAVIDAVGTEDMAALKKAISRAYPFGERKYHPYKIWLDEVGVQLGEKTPATGGRAKMELIKYREAMATKKEDDND